jgi:hypothetical protein
MARSRIILLPERELGTRTSTHQMTRPGMGWSVAGRRGLSEPDALRAFVLGIAVT